MQYVHIKNLEKYHPGYKDRHLIWCKTYFSMMNSDIEFELLEEIDRWRFICFAMVELQLKKPVPLNEYYLVRKGFDFKKKSLAKTIRALNPLIILSNEDENLPKEDTPIIYIENLQGVDLPYVTEKYKHRNAGVTQNRIDIDIDIEKNRVEKNRKEEIYSAIVTDLNLVLNSTYKETTFVTIKFINARLKEGFTLEDFKTVHRKMFKKWSTDNKMRPFLRPQTLYGTKFESYLNMPDDILNLKEDKSGTYRRDSGKDNESTERQKILRGIGEEV